MIILRIVVGILAFYWLMDSIAAWKRERFFKKLSKELEEKEANKKKRRKKKYSTPPEFRSGGLVH